MFSHRWFARSSLQKDLVVSWSVILDRVWGRLLPALSSDLTPWVGRCGNRPGRAHNDTDRHVKVACP